MSVVICPTFYNIKTSFEAAIYKSGTQVQPLCEAVRFSLHCSRVVCAACALACASALQNFLKEGELMKVSRKEMQPRWFILVSADLVLVQDAESSSETASDSNSIVRL